MNMQTVTLNRQLRSERTYWTKNEEEAKAFSEFWGGKLIKGWTGIFFIYVKLPSVPL